MINGINGPKNFEGLGGSLTIKSKGVTGTSPINRLITDGAFKIPDLLKNVQLAPEGASLVCPIKHQDLAGEIKFEIYAIPEPEKLSNFWTKIGIKLGFQKNVPLEPVAVKISDDVRLGTYRPGFHTQLMANYPYAVLEDGTRYALSFTAPKALIGQWEDYEKMISFNEFEVGKRQSTICVAIRTDDGQPLVRAKCPTREIEYYDELMLSFQTEENRDDAYCGIDQRITDVSKEKKSFKVGEEIKSQTLQQDLIFSSPPKGTIKGDMEDKKGLIEVVIFSVWSKIVSEIITRPLNIKPAVRSPFDLLEKGGSNLSYGGFRAGETTFGKETKRKVNISGCEIIDLIAAFKLVLVGENNDANLIMTEAPAPAGEKGNG